MNDFKNAYDDAMYVIEKTGHSLLEDYAMVRQSNEANDEVIFAVNYNNSTNNNNNQQVLIIYSLT